MFVIFYYGIMFQRNWIIVEKREHFTRDRILFKELITYFFYLIYFCNKLLGKAKELIIVCSYVENPLVN